MESLNSYGVLDLQTLKDNLNKIGTVTKGDAFPIKVLVDGYEFTINSSGTIEGIEDEETIATTDVYPILYTDGTLSFGITNDPIAGKTVSKSYGNIKDTVYTSELNSDGVRIADTPWFGDKDSIKSVVFVNEIKPKSTANWFNQCTNLASIEGMDKLNTSQVIDMSYMFYSCVKLTSLDLSSFDTSNVTDMAWMFGGGGSNTMLLTEIKGLEQFNTSKVTTMRDMFYNCVKLTSLDLRSFDTSNVANMAWMFGGGSSNTMLLTEIKGLEQFNTSKVTTMNSMFQNCVKLTSLDLSSFDTSNVTDMAWMFGADGGSNPMLLTEIKGLEQFNTSKVTTMNCMFKDCAKLTILDLSSFDTNKVTDMDWMFCSTSSMKTIYVGPNWTMKNVTSSSNMYYNSGVSSTTLKTTN